MAPVIAREGLDISALELTLRQGALRVPSLSLSPGEVYHVASSDQLFLEELLFVLAGLRRALIFSRPAAPGTLARQRVEPDDDELRKVFLGGQALSDLPASERARKVGLVFRNPEWAILGGSVIEEFWFSFEAAGLSIPPDFRLKKYGIFDQRGQATMTLSGGEMQRLNCATALEAERSALIADFSRSNLDEDFLADFIDWVHERAQAGAVVVLAGLRSDELPADVTHLELREGVLSECSTAPTSLASIESEASMIQDALAPRVVTSECVLWTDQLFGRHTAAPLSLSMKKGEIVVLRGPNGSGKTSLARMIVEREQGYSGSYELGDGVEPVMSFQHPEHCFFSECTKDEVTDEALLHLCGIPDSLWNTHPRNLGLSQQKLLNVATALASSHGLAVLDEPTCGMCTEGKRRFVDLLNAFDRHAVLVITHDRSLRGLGRQIGFGEEAA